MYKRAIAATAALAAPALGQAVGSAVVINSCDYPVYLQNTPSAGGGFSAISQTLATGASYSQVYTELSNGNGWSLKLSQTPNAFESQIMQYEYTWHGWEGAFGGIIWYDLSDVDGNPWDGNWELTATGDCTPRQAAYLYSTDDAYGEQSCPASSSITVELCSGSSNGGSAPAQSPSSPSPATSAPASTDAPGIPGWQAGGQAFENKAATTLATVGRGGVTVTDIATAVVTTYVTAASAPTGAPAPAKRFEHLARHAHGHRH